MNDMTSASPTPAAKPKPRPRPQVMKLTEAAAQRITELTKRADSEIVGLRVGIKNGGCAGQSYTVEYAHEVRPTDEVVEDKGVKILVDPKAVLFLLGTEMDYKADKMQAQFIFNNPEPGLRLRLRRVGATDAGEGVVFSCTRPLRGRVGSHGAQRMRDGRGDGLSTSNSAGVERPSPHLGSHSCEPILRSRGGCR